MDFKSVACRSAYFSKFTWRTADVPEDTKFYGACNLSSICIEDTVASDTFTYTYVDAIPATFVARFFSYWRGSLVITLKVVKTNYHSGRLIFSMLPTNG